MQIFGLNLDALQVVDNSCVKLICRTLATFEATVEEAIPKQIVIRISINEYRNKATALLLHPVSPCKYLMV